MEKKRSPTQLGISLGSVPIYRDDLEEIVSILTEMCKQIINEDNEYRYESLDEVLDKRGPHPRLEQGFASHRLAWLLAPTLSGGGRHLNGRAVPAPLQPRRLHEYQA